MTQAIRILVVDDNRFMRETLSFVISHVKYFELAGTAQNGEEAIIMNAKLLPDVILMDINMSPMNGFETAKKILAEKPSTRIIGISVHRHTGYADLMLLIGGKGYLTKSSPHQEIIHAIKEVYQNRNYISSDVENTRHSIIG